MHKHLVTAVALALGVANMASAAPVEFAVSGGQPADLQATIKGFRDAIGGNNNNVGGSFTDGRREINWDGVPDAVAAPNLMPPNFFHANSNRGIVFFTPGSGFQISAKLGNPTATPVEFGNISPGLPQQFQTFSPQRLFTALDSAITEALFFKVDTGQAAAVRAFGAVFTGVTHAGSTHIEYFDANGKLLHSQLVPPSRHAGLSFAGTFFDPGENVYLVRITSGNVELGAAGLLANPHGDDPVDLVVMDDFIYSEPLLFQ